MEDSLSKEIKLQDAVRGGGGGIATNNSSIRPNTTGEGVVVMSKLPSRASDTVKAIVNTGMSERIRPRAPKQAAKQVRNRTGSIPPPRVENREGRIRRKSSSNSSLQELWEELNKFSKNNIGRSLDGANKLDEIHYVNIISDKEAPNNSASMKPQNNPRKAGTSSESQFAIPELPSGHLLVFNILSTWGDPYYLGLMGIEVFDSTGHIVKLSNLEKQIWADPSDINVLPEYDNDPRVVDNLLDGVNHTCDDLHAWLTPFTSGQDHLIYMKFDDITTISMIRIWNYNKSRIHSTRGARYMEITLDGIPVFKGEIKRSIGSNTVNEYDQCCECILFTNSNRILGLIEKYDPMVKTYNQAMDDEVTEREIQSGSKVIGGFSGSEDMFALDSNDDEDSGTDEKEQLPSFLRNSPPRYNTTGRPTASADVLNGELNSAKECLVSRLDSSREISTTVGVDPLNPRPLTGKAKSRSGSFSDLNGNSINGNEMVDEINRFDDLTVNTQERKVYVPSRLQTSYDGDRKQNLLRPSTALIARSQRPVCGRFLEMRIFSSWGDKQLVGLTGVTAVDADLNEVILETPEVSICYLDDVKIVSRKPNFQASPRLIVQEPFLTVDPSNMWLTEHPCSNEFVQLKFDLKGIYELKGLRVWNYNSIGAEDTCRGAKHVAIYLDGRLYCQTTVRKALGEALFDFSQFLPFSQLSDNQSSNVFPSLDSDSADSSEKHRKRVNWPQDLSKSMDASMYKPLVAHLTALRESTGKPAQNGEQEHLRLSEKRGKQSVLQTSADRTRYSPLSSGAVEEEDNEHLSEDDGESYRLEESDELNFVASQNRFGTATLEPSSYTKAPKDYELLQQYETPLHPSGCMVKFVLHSTHGDGYYIGLNGIQLFDHQGDLISFGPDELQASPYRDVNDLPQFREKGYDARCLENLVNGLNNTFNDRNMWLAPYSGPNSASRRGGTNTLFFLSDTPITIGLIKIWNYSKSPQRGVKEIEIFVDDVIVFSGSLLKSPKKGDLPPIQPPLTDIDYIPGELNWGSAVDYDLSQSILFSDNLELLEREKFRIPMPDEDIEFFDEGQIVQDNGPPAPLTSDSSFRRPMTSVVGVRGMN